MNNHYYDCIGDIADRYCKPDLGYNLELDLYCPEYSQDADGRVTIVNNPSEVYKLRANQIKPPQSELTTGTDRDRIYVETYAVEPREIPFDLGDELNGRYLYEGNWIDCKFYQVPRLADNFTENTRLHKVIGRCIHGYLKFEGVV